MKGAVKTKARRTMEREYLATLNDAVPPDTWQAICKRAADDALDGDAEARDWLARCLLGLELRRPSRLAAEASAAAPAEATDDESAAQRHTIEDERRRAEREQMLFQLLY